MKNNEIKMRISDNERVDKLNAEIRRRRAADSVYDAVKGGIDIRSMDLGYSKQAIDDAIWVYGLILEIDGKLVAVKQQKAAPAQSPAVEKFDQFVSDAIASNDPSMREFGKLLTQCTASDDWLTDGIEEEITKPLGEAPTFPGCHLKHPERAAKDGYYFYTGGEAAITMAAAYLWELGVSVWPHANGINGSWKMRVPTWVTGEVSEYCSTLEEEYVNEFSGNTEKRSA